MLKKLKKNKKGFTLAELLIVVAIIGVLVAVSIPIFTAQLEKARESTDLANIRAAKAAAVSAYLTEDATLGLGSAQTENKTLYYDAGNGVLKTSANGITAYGKGTTTEGAAANAQLGYDPKKAAAGVFIVVVTPAGEVTITSNQ